MKKTFIKNHKEINKNIKNFLSRNIKNMEKNINSFSCEGEERIIKDLFNPENHHPLYGLYKKILFNSQPERLSEKTPE